MNNAADKITLTLIGCGKMGGAMMRGWLASGIIAHAHIYDPHPIDSDLSSHALVTTHDAHSSVIDTLSESQLVILAVKPQGMDSVLDELSPHLPLDTTILSIAAGLDRAYFESKMQSGQPFIRVMPNTPCAIGKGISALYANDKVTEGIKQSVTALFSALGDAFWIDNEDQMNAVTAVSGSGPAYIFHFIEALTKAAENIGFSPDIALRLARQTVIGSASLAESEADTSASTLRKNVTSPGGTTEAGLGELMRQSNGLEDILNDTVQAALRRGIELGQKK